MNDRAILTLQASTREQTGVAGNGATFDVSMYSSAVFFLCVTAQGSYTDETLDVKIQTKDPLSGNWVDLTWEDGTGTPQNTAFTQVGDKTGSVPYTERIVCLDLPDSHIRVYWVAAGTAEDYTFSVSAVVKG